MIFHSKRSLLVLATWALLLASSPGRASAPVDPGTTLIPVPAPRTAKQTSGAAVSAPLTITTSPLAKPKTSGEEGFAIWVLASGWLARQGVAGLVLLGVLAVLGYGLSQAQNIEVVLRRLGRDRKASESAPPPPSFSTSGPSSPVITGGTLSSTGGHLVIGDQVGGVKVMGDQHIHPAPKPRPELPTSHTPHNLPELTTAPDRFVGRKAQLDKLSQRLEPPGSRVLLTGMGGVGKSELVLQHAYAQLEHYRGGIVRLDARQGYDGMAAEVLSFVRGHFPDLLPDKGPPEELLPLCWSQWPSAESSSEPVLLLLDDLPCDGTGEESARRLCKGLPPRFRRLITRREKAPPGVASIDLEVLERPDSILLLRLQAEGPADGRGRVEAEADAADFLCQEVGDLPLALVLLGARLAQQPDLRIANLLEDLKAKGAEASALRDSHPELGARQGMVESLLISWEPLSASAKELAVLLSLMAPAVIPWELVEACRREEQELVEGSAFGVAQAELLRAQLLKRVGPDRYRLHPLVRSFAALKADDAALALLRDDWRQKLAKVVAIKCRTNFAQVMPLARAAEVELLLPHIAHVAENMTDALSEGDLITPFTCLGGFFLNRAEVSRAMYWFSLGNDLCEQRLGEKHPSTAISINNLACVLLEEDRPVEAEPLIRRALAITKDRKGSSHPDVARALNNLAVILQATNRISESETLQLRAIDIFNANFGPFHHDMAISLNNLALNMEATSRTTEAELFYRISLAINSTCYGPNHPTSGIIQGNLASLLQKADRQGEAELMFRQSLTNQLSSHGPSHPDVANALNNLGILLAQTQRYSEAEPLIRQALDIFLRKFGIDHPDTISTMKNYVLLLQAKGISANVAKARLQSLLQPDNKKQSNKKQ